MTYFGRDPRAARQKTMNVRCRVAVSREFPILARLRFLFTGRMFVSIINGKAHTAVVLSTTKPIDKPTTGKRKA